MGNVFLRMMRWFELGKRAKTTVRSHLSSTSSRRCFVDIRYRLDDVIVVCASYRDHNLPLRTFHLFDALTGSVKDVVWTDVRKLVPNRKTWC